MEKTPIYSLMETSVIGELSIDTEVREQILCDDCGMTGFRPELEGIIFHLDYWSGEDLMEAHLFRYAATKRLKDEIQAKLKGVFFETLNVSKGEKFEIYTEDHKELPSLYHLKINNVVRGNEIWYKKNTL